MQTEASTYLGALFRSEECVPLISFVNTDFPRKCIDLINKAPPTAFTPGDEGHHSWLELSGPELFELNSVVCRPALERIIGGTITKHHQWINVYGPGQYIPDHQDAAGDVHLLVIVQAPPAFWGGSLWVDSPENVIPLGTGDCLLFRASKLLHGSIPFQGLGAAQRITFNCRMWIEPADQKNFAKIG